MLFSHSVVSDSTTPRTAAHQAFPVLHHLPELAQIHVHWVIDAIQPSHPLPSPSPLAFNLSQHQGLFQWVGSLHQVAKVLALQHQSFFLINIQDWFPLGLTGWIYLQSKGLSRVFSNTMAQKHQFCSVQPSLYIIMLLKYIQTRIKLLVFITIHMTVKSYKLNPNTITKPVLLNQH